MDLVSFDPSRPGVFAFGQEAYGLVAVGQFATGIVAVGQVARGVIAVGQAAAGVVAFGQAALGVAYAGGMVAVGGRGFGFCLKLLPTVVSERFDPPQLPPLSTLEDFSSRRVDDGWMVVHVKPAGPELLIGREPAPFEMRGAAIRKQLRDAVAAGHNRACVRVVSEERATKGTADYREPAERTRVLTAKRMISWREARPGLRLEGPFTSSLGILLRIVAMLALSFVYGSLVFSHLGRLVF